jgi:hypothetical protein
MPPPVFSAFSPLQLRLPGRIDGISLYGQGAAPSSRREGPRERVLSRKKRKKTKKGVSAIDAVISPFFVLFRFYRLLLL